MDFNEPLPSTTGFIIYNLMMEFMDGFIHDYAIQMGGNSYPSLRITTDMMLTLLSDLQSLDLSDVLHKDLPKDEVIVKLLSKLRALSSKKETFDSTKHGLFTDEINSGSAWKPEQPTKSKKKPAKVKEPPMEPFVLTDEADVSWLKSTGITMEQLSSPKEKHE
jgi:hypothetical protein